MTLKSTLLAACSTLAFAATGCFSGDLDTGDPGPTPGSPDAGVVQDDPDAGGGGGPVPETAQALFEANVRPVVQATCSPGGACHSAQTPAFVSADPNTAYTVIMANRDVLFPGYDAATSSLIINGTNGHQGASYLQTDIDAISAWLAAEKLEADNGGDDGASPLAMWSGCMELTDWDNEQVATGWSNKNAQGQGNCEACHNLGGEGWIASDQSQRVFDTITQNPFYMGSYFTLNAAGTDVVINRARLENVGNQLPPHEAHGAFDVDGNAMERLVRFYDLTMARMLAGQCGPSKFQ